MQRKLNDEFIKEYSEEFSEKITSDFFQQNEKISGKQILSLTPSKQVNFFVLKILFRKWQEEMKRLESPFFNYKNTEVRKAMVQFMNTLSQHIEMGQDHLVGMLEEAVADTLLIAADPGSYLIMEFDALDVPQVNEKLTKPILKYLRLHKEDVQSFFEENNQVSLDEFLDNAETYFDELDTAEVVNHELTLLSGVVPVSEEELFMDEDSFANVEDSEEEDIPRVEEDLMEEEPDEEENVEFYSDEEAYEDGEPEPETLEEQEADDDEELSFEPAQAEEESVPDEMGEEVEADDEPLNVDEEESDEAEYTEETAEHSSGAEDWPEETPGEEIAPDESVNEQFSETSETINDTFSKKSNTLADQLEQKKVQTIMEGISVNHRYMFTKELFDGSREAFTEAIAAIEACESFDDAVELLVQTYAKERAWDMNSEEVKELLKVVFRKFR